MDGPRQRTGRTVRDRILAPDTEPDHRHHARPDGPPQAEPEAIAWTEPAPHGDDRTEQRADAFRGADDRADRDGAADGHHRADRGPDGDHGAVGGTHGESAPDDDHRTDRVTGSDANAVPGADRDAVPRAHRVRGSDTYPAERTDGIRRWGTALGHRRRRLGHVRRESTGPR